MGVVTPGSQNPGLAKSLLDPHTKDSPIWELSTKMRTWISSSPGPAGVRAHGIGPMGVLPWGCGRFTISARPLFKPRTRSSCTVC